MKKPFYIKKVSRKKGFSFLYRLNKESGIVDHDQTTFHAIPIPQGYLPATSRAKAAHYVEIYIEREKQRQQANRARKSGDQSFRDYAQPYFIWKTCAHVERLLDEGKRIGKTHVAKSRQWLEQHVFDDPFAAVIMTEAKRADFLDLRGRLKAKGLGYNTINKVMQSVKTVFSEAFFRNDIDYNPGSGIGNINYKKKEIGIFQQLDYLKLFKEIPGPFGDLRTYCVFNTAAKLGMRCSEVLALSWQAIDFSDQLFDVFQTWKGDELSEYTKTGDKRKIPVVDSVIKPLKRLQEESIRVAPTDLVFCYDDGLRLGYTWWRKNFYESMVRAGLAAKIKRPYTDKKGKKRISYTYQNRQGKSITPHSFRHSLNSHLLGAGCNPIKVRAYLGWRDDIKLPNLTPTQEGYTHWPPELLRDLLPYIDQIFGKAKIKKQSPR